MIFMEGSIELRRRLRVAARSIRCLADIDMVIAAIGCLGHIDIRAAERSRTSERLASGFADSGELLDFAELLPDT